MALTRKALELIFIEHRINELGMLRKVPANHGVEIDLRTLNGDLILAHDAFKSGERFVDWLGECRHKLAVLNVKEDGLEEPLRELMKRSSVQNYFFLDQAMPTLIRDVIGGHTTSALRYSEYESIENLKYFAGKGLWLWVDCFTDRPYDSKLVTYARDLSYKICLVSPELHSSQREPEVEVLASQVLKSGVFPDAVCSKRADIWIPVCEQALIEEN